MLNKKAKILALFFFIITILGVMSFLVARNLSNDENVNINQEQEMNQNTNQTIDQNENKNINIDEPKQDPIIIDGVDISDWKTYRNEEYGYLIKYPRDWETKEVRYYEKDLGLLVKYISFYDDEYYLIFLFNKKNENFSIGRTGVGAGDFKNIRSWKIDGVDIRIKDLVYKDKIKEIFFSGSSDLHSLSGYFSSSQNAYVDNFYFDKKKYKIAENIIKSFRFTNIEK